MKRLLLLLLILAAAPLFAQSYSAILNGPDADGAGFAVVTIDGTTLDYSVLAQGIGTVTAADIVNAGGTSVVVLTPSSLVNGSTTISAGVAGQINANPSAYSVVLKTAEFADGAIRGALARASEGDGLRTAWLPVVGKVTGAAGTNFVTDLRIVNNGGALANVTLDFFTQNAGGNASATASAAITVAPGEQKVLDDVMAALNQNGVLGGLKVTADQNVLVTARVINDLRAESKGTAGFAYDADATGRTGGTLAFLASNADYRTNIGYFNPSTTAVNATFVARRADGSILGTNTISIPGYAMAQQPAFNLISSVADANRSQADFFVTWSSDAPLFVYGAVTDNKTGDAVLNR